MWEYLLGIILGTTFILLMFSIFCFFLFKQIKHNKNIKMISLKSESKINNDIMTWAKQTKKFFIPNSIFKYHQNKIFKVNSILVTPQAVFVIEIKSIRGNIVGDVHKSFWIKILNNIKYKISNPVFQNEKHIEHIIKMLNMKIPIVSFVIFSNRADHIRVKNIPEHVVIFKHNELFEKLDDIARSLKVSFTDYEMRTIFEQIKSFKTTKRSDTKIYNKMTNPGKYWWK